MGGNLIFVSDDKSFKLANIGDDRISWFSTMEWGKRFTVSR